MTRKMIFLVLVLTLLFVAVTPVMAAPGGLPGAHGVDGKTFGGLVAGLAQADPAALVSHITGSFP